MGVKENIIALAGTQCFAERRIIGYHNTVESKRRGFYGFF